MAAATASIALTKTGWTLICDNAKKGLVSNPLQHYIFVRKDNSLPGSEVTGGVMVPAFGEINVDLTDGSETGYLYGRLSSGYSQNTGDITFTEA